MSLITKSQHVFSGMCVCGHPADQHHGNMIMNELASVLLGGYVFYGECEHFGFNEAWEQCPECPRGFIDQADPLKEAKLAE